MGATVLTENEIIPYFTTHIITNLITESLKQEVDRLFGASKNSIFYQDTAKIVTEQWLVDCLKEGKILNEKEYRPKEEERKVR